MGKGSGARPFSVSREEYDNRFDNIFRKNRNENSQQSQSGTQDSASGTDNQGSEPTAPATGRESSQST